MSRAAQFKKVSHVIFDMDGIILDTEPLYTLAIQNIVGKYGKTYDWEMKYQIMGLTGMEAAHKMVELLDLPLTPQELYALAQAEYAIVMQDTKLLPGVEKVVRHLHKHKIPIAVATSSSQDSFKLKAKNHKEFFSLFRHIVTGGSDPEVKEGKPKPDIFLVCASRFCDKPYPEKCLVFEDAPNGVTAAKCAGMQVIMVPDENVPSKLRREADIVICGLDDAPLELFGLPPLKPC